MIIIVIIYLCFLGRWADSCRCCTSCTLQRPYCGLKCPHAAVHRACSRTGSKPCWVLHSGSLADWCASTTSMDCKAYLDVPKVVNDRPLQHLLVQGANPLICYISVQALHQHRCLLCYVLLHCAQRQQIRDDDTSALLQVATERLQYPRPCLQQSKHAETPLSVQKQLLSSD